MGQGAIAFSFIAGHFTMTRSIVFTLKRSDSIPFEEFDSLHALEPLVNKIELSVTSVFVTSSIEKTDTKLPISNSWELRRGMSKSLSEISHENDFDLSLWESEMKRTWMIH